MACRHYHHCLQSADDGQRRALGLAIRSAGDVLELQNKIVWPGFGKRLDANLIAIPPVTNCVLTGLEAADPFDEAARALEPRPFAYRARYDILNYTSDETRFGLEIGETQAVVGDSIPLDIVEGRTNAAGPTFAQAVGEVLPKIEGVRMFACGT